ncbi:MAG: hypothetical protein ACRDRX_25755 [Pseudonocardiaceae bacterium]
MIREDRELLTELARVNRELAPLALRQWRIAPVSPNSRNMPSV